ncbi:MAG: TRAP transporter small permease subunit [Syntrophales bacterium]|nr:TRAP transporter small permease subunit [Syntrophales bacterium]MCK9528478.1 TRAP transporter small permease subunit [Syntrophales bacterium]MDX9923015.1 TRAP transporter small permease subunit [Syntrophales bacterium]
MKALLAISRRIDTFSKWSGVIFSYLLIPLVLLVVFEVITRQFNRPTIWTFESVSFLYGAHFMLVAAYGLLTKSHVCIDLVSSRFSVKINAIFSLICYVLLFFPFIIVFTYYGIDYSYFSWLYLETSWSAWGPPLYYIKTVIPITAVMLLVQGISEVIKNIGILTGVKEVAE